MKDRATYSSIKTGQASTYGVHKLIRTCYAISWVSILHKNNHRTFRIIIAQVLVNLVPKVKKECPFVFGYGVLAIFLII